MKKFLLVLLGLLALFVLGLVGIGLAFESVEYENTIVIDRPPERVWEVFTDVDRTKEWMTGLERIENLSGEHLEVGSRWRLVIREDGEEQEMIETVTAVEENRRFAFDLEAEPMVAHTEITLTPEGEGTRLAARNVVRGRGLLWRAVLWLSQTMFEGHSQQHYVRLKKLVEQSPG